MADDLAFTDDEPVDEGTGLANGVVIVTGVILLLAIVAMLVLLKEHFQRGLLA